jgi:hypothetical protein
MEFFSVLFGLVTKVGFSVLVLLIAILLALYYGQNNMLYIPNVGKDIYYY